MEEEDGDKQEKRVPFLSNLISSPTHQKSTHAHTTHGMDVLWEIYLF